MISHRNVIANSLQIAASEKPYRDGQKKPGEKYDPTEIALGLLPQSHIYALVVICHATVYRGDQVINLPKFDMGHLLGAVQRFKIGSMFLVCSMGASHRNCSWQLRRQWLILIVLSGTPNNHQHGEQSSSPPKVRPELYELNLQRCSTSRS